MITSKLKYQINIIIFFYLVILFLSSLNSQAHQNDFLQSGGTNQYIFLPQYSALIQNGGIAGVHWTYAIEGDFLLAIAPAAGTVSFVQVDANAVDDSIYKRTQNLSEVFALTSLSGTVLDDRTIKFTGSAADGSSVNITAIFGEDLIFLIAETTPPPHSADFFIFTMIAAAQRKYAGGTGEPDEPYKIAGAADLILLGETSEDYDKHFILINDIVLDPNLPFDRAVIAPYIIDMKNKSSVSVDTPFTGSFDGNGYVISNLTINGTNNLGLFGRLGLDAEVKNLGVIDVNIVGLHSLIGGLAGSNLNGMISNCHSTGTVIGGTHTGGLMGYNGGTVNQCSSISLISGISYTGGLIGRNSGTLIQCYSDSSVHGNINTGGLIGYNWGGGNIIQSYSIGIVSGNNNVGGLVGRNINTESVTTHYVYNSIVSNCFSMSIVSGNNNVGGLVGQNSGTIEYSYCNSTVSGIDCAGGLVGYNLAPGEITQSFWDIETSGLTTSAGGEGKTIAEMQMQSTYTDAGWDFVGETANGTEDIWWILDGQDYPKLWWQLHPEN